MGSCYRAQESDNSSHGTLIQCDTGSSINTHRLIAFMERKKKAKFVQPQLVVSGPQLLAVQSSRAASDWVSGSTSLVTLAQVCG